MAYVIIVEFRAKPDRIQAFAELIDRHAHNSRTLEDGCLAFDVCQDPDDRRSAWSSKRRITATRRRITNISRWTLASSDHSAIRATGRAPPTLSCLGSKSRCLNDGHVVFDL